MDTLPDDLNSTMMLDGNAVAGELQEIFGHEMTSNLAECAGCGAVSMFGTLRAFTQAPGLVLRCPHCGDVVLRVVKTPRGIHLDVRGSTSLRFLLGVTASESDERP